MVQLTSEAALLLNEVKKAYKIPNDHGLRFFEEAEDGQEPEVRLTFVDAPAPSDIVEEQEKHKLFVAPEVKDRLEGASLEAKAGERPVILIKYPDDE
jgi:Fe-S cluster assembly iron-binding protein IscA